MLRNWICFVCIAAAAGQGLGQSGVSTAAILASAKTDPGLSLYEGHLDFLRNTNLRLPLVEQIGIRTETDRFLLQQQEYLTRVSFNGVKEMYRQNRLQQAERLEAETRQRVLLHEALADRYALLLQDRYDRREIILQQHLAVLCDDKIRVLSKLLELNAEADVDELIKAEYDRDELAMRLLGLENRNRQIAFDLRRWAPDQPFDGQVDTLGFMPAERLNAVVSGLPTGMAFHPEMVEQTAKIARIDAEFQLEKARSQQMIDFVQMRYQNRPKETLNGDLAVGIGINLPYKGSSNVKMNALKIEKNAASMDATQFVLEAARRVDEAKELLLQLDGQRRLARQQLADGQAQYTLQQAAAGQIQRPMVLLRAQELLLKRELRLLGIERDMFVQYLNVLDWSGALSAQPLVNFLAADLKTF